MHEHSFQEYGLRIPIYSPEFIDLAGNINPRKPTYEVDAYCSICGRFYIINQDKEIVYEY